ncbi:hypothetical protein K9U38_06400, partial [Phyllobacterium sp. 2063]|nr:hypothetical protein [Phyllobacterium sp. 2063]
MKQFVLTFNSPVEIYTHPSIRAGSAGFKVAARDRSSRRRLMAILRMACRILGLKRKGRRLGLTGLARNATTIAAGAALIATLSSSVGLAGGIFINDGNDQGCMEVADSGNVTSALKVQNDGSKCFADNGKQKDRVVFFGSGNGPTGLSLGGNLHVTGTADVYNILNARSRLNVSDLLSAEGGSNLYRTVNIMNDLHLYQGKIWLEHNDQNLTIGDTKANAAGIKSIALGNNTRTTSKDSIAIGPDAQAGWIGTGAARDQPADDSGSIAIGAGAKSLEKDGLALGRNSVTADSMTGATALGSGAQALFLGGVALGYNSVTDKAAVAIGTVRINNTDYTFAGATPYSTVSIGNATIKRQLTNLAAGQLNKDSTDGVNGSQLFATNSAVDALGDRVTSITSGALGGGLVQQATPDANITVGAATQGTAVDFRSSAGARRLLNVANGKVEKESLEAVNGGQLFDTDTRVTKNEGDISTINTTINNINSGKAGLVQQSAPGQDITVAKDLDGAAIDIGGTFAGAKGSRKLRGLAA